MKRCLIECGVPQASEADALAMNVSEPGRNLDPDRHHSDGRHLHYRRRSVVGERHAGARR